MNKTRLLIVEDDPDGRRSVEEALQDLAPEVISTATGQEGVDLFRQKPFDVVLTDLVLPDIDGIEVLGRIRNLDPQTPVLLMTAYGSVPSSVKALKSGAYDYITKPLDLEDLQSTVTRALETRRLRNEVAQLHKSVHERYTASHMTAGTPEMHELLRQIEAMANTKATVLIQGESGTGKELVARALHVDSARASGPFVAVNCGAFSETLLESELFGHEKGAFTGATQQRKGAFERADGGTLFLDEIGDAPRSVQVKLLRVLEDKEVMRLGGQASFHVDTRLVSATNKDLPELAQNGEFREDLLYRLKVVTLTVPPLRERKDDIRALTDRFIAAACEEHGRAIQSVEPDYYEALLRHDWPGNIRQLKNAVESSVLMATEPVLRAASIPEEGRRPARDAGIMLPDGMTLEELEREALSQTLRRCEGNRTLAAERLGISRRTIQRKIQDYNLPF